MSRHAGICVQDFPFPTSLVPMTFARRKGERCYEPQICDTPDPTTQTCADIQGQIYMFAENPVDAIYGFTKLSDMISCPGIQNICLH